MKATLSVLIPTLNEQDFIADCLNSVQGWADEIIISDSGSTDDTLKIAKKFKGVKILKSPTGSFQTWRNHLLQKASKNWIFYLDADERATPELKEEIANLLNSHLPLVQSGDAGGRAPVGAHFANGARSTNGKETRGRTRLNNSTYAIPRRNFLLGKEMHHGGWYPDYVKRLFLKKL